MRLSAPPDTALLHTPLHALHLELGARMVPFAGYAMPVQYPAGLVAEHRHTRAAAGLFDVSHMGQMRLSGPDAAAALESLIPMDVIDLPPGKEHYLTVFADDFGKAEPNTAMILINDGVREQTIDLVAGRSKQESVKIISE